MFHTLPQELIDIILIDTFVNSHVSTILNLINVCKIWKNIIYTKKLIIHNNICLPIQTKIHLFVNNKLPYIHVSGLNCSPYIPSDLLFIKYMPLCNKNASKLFLYLARQLLFNQDLCSLKKYNLKKYNEYYCMILTEFRIEVNNLCDYKFGFQNHVTNSFYLIYMITNQGRYYNFSRYILNYYIHKKHIILHFKNKYLNQHEMYIINEIFTNEKFINYMKNFNMSINEYKN